MLMVCGPCFVSNARAALMELSFLALQSTAAVVACTTGQTTRTARSARRVEVRLRPNKPSFIISSSEYGWLLAPFGYRGIGLHKNRNSLNRRARSEPAKRRSEEHTSELQSPTN